MTGNFTEKRNVLVKSTLSSAIINKSDLINKAVSRLTMSLRADHIINQGFVVAISAEEIFNPANNRSA